MPGERSELRVRIGKWQLDVKDRTLTAGTQTKRLSPRAWETLVYLARNAGEVVTKEELLLRFWRGDLSEDTAVRKSILEIRRALEDDPNNPSYIKTVTKQGYALVAEVVEDVGDAANAIAILPFNNLTGDPGNDHLGDGLAEELINVLAHRGAVAVVARNSSFKFKGQQVAVPEIAEALNAAFVVEGSIRRHQGNIRTTVQLVDAHSGLHMFSRNFDHELESEIQLYDAVAAEAGQALLATLASHGFVEQPAADGRLPTETAAPPAALETPEKQNGSRWRPLLALTILATVFGGAFFIVNLLDAGFFRTAPLRKSIAVLPFRDLDSRGGNSGPITLGFYNDVVHQLKGVADLTVTPGDVAQRHHLGESTAMQIGDALNVAYLLTGTVQRDADSTRVTAQLVETIEGVMIWSEQYAADEEIPGDMLRDTAERIASQIAVTLTEAAQGRLAATNSWEAFQLLQQALALNDHRLWNEFIADAQVVELLRQSLAADRDYFDAKYWLTVALLSLPDAYAHALELGALGPELLAQKPDDPWVNRVNARIIELAEGETPSALARRERLLRNAVKNRGDLWNFHVDLALFLWQVDLATDALDVMLEWNAIYPGVISPLFAQLDLSFNHDTQLAAHYADVVLANRWGAPENVSPYHQLRNDFVSSVRLLSLPGDSLNQQALLAVALFALGDPQAALRWLNWLDGRGSGAEYRKTLQFSVLRLLQRESELVEYVEKLRQAGDPAYVHGERTLALLRAELADNEDDSRTFLEQAFRSADVYWSARKTGPTYNLRGFQMGGEGLGFAILAARFDAQASQIMLDAVFAHYEAGAAHWNIADKYAILTLAHAMSGNLDAAVEQFSLAERYGFRSLNMLKLYGVFAESNAAIFHDLHQDSRFLELVERIGERNQETLAAIKSQMPQALQPGCYEAQVVERRFGCTVPKD